MNDVLSQKSFAPSIAPDLYQYFQKDSIIITPNNRLSQYLLTEFAKNELLNNAYDFINKPYCLPYQMFLRKLYFDITQQNPAINHPQLLTHIQKRQLWRKVLDEDGTKDGFLDLVDDAWTRSNSWLIDMDSEEFLYNQQTELFQRYQQQFKIYLRELYAITEDEIINYIKPFLKDYNNRSKLVWVCFDDFTPAQLLLKKLLINHHSINYDLNLKDTIVEQYEAPDSKDEIKQLIQWIKSRQNNHDKRIAIVVPNLEENAKILQRVFKKHFNDNDFNISLGQNLTNYHFIAHALEIITFNNEKVITYEFINLLLHSSYIGGSKTEFLLRTSAIRNNECLQENHVYLTVFIDILKSHTPILYNIVKNISTYPLKASVEKWIELFKKKLSEFNFPGEYTLSSESYQCFERLNVLFDDFLQIATITPELSKNQALHILKDIAKKSIFQIQKHEPPIQILGLLEASGIKFDSIWMLGVTNQCLPQKTILSPYIPVTIQRNNKMPRALTDREIKLAKIVLKRLANASDRLVLSYSRLDDDLPNMPSSLLNDLPLYIPKQVNNKAKEISLFEYKENYQHPINDTNKIKGGTRIIENQAQCPFKAFAIQRLNATEPVRITQGITRKDRGKILHKVLEIFWQKLPNQNTLIELCKTSIDEHIDNTINKALNYFDNDTRYSLNNFIKYIEIEQLKKILHSVVEFESSRPYFEIEALEKEFAVNLGDFNIKVRVDRIDTIPEDNQLLVIDYKTTLPSKMPWNEQRPQNPQLLLYALLNPDISTLIFMQVRVDQIKNKGISAHNSNINGVKTINKSESFEDYQARWHDSLQLLATEFINGYCQPIPQPECSSCFCQDICRVMS